jgi:hypothetical protein
MTPVSELQALPKQRRIEAYNLALAGFGIEDLKVKLGISRELAKSIVYATDLKWLR